MRTDEVSPFAEAFCEEYARLLHMVLTSPNADRCVHCVCDREQEDDERIMLFDQVGRLAEIHLASMLPAMSGQSPVVKLHGWEEGRYVVSQKEIVFRANMTGPHKIWLRLDRGATCMKATSRSGPRWNQVRRRVTVNDVTKRVLADQMVEEIRDPFEKLDRAVDLMTVLY